MNRFTIANPRRRQEDPNRAVLKPAEQSITFLPNISHSVRPQAAPPLLREKRLLQQRLSKQQQQASSLVLPSNLPSSPTPPVPPSIPSSISSNLAYQQQLFTHTSTLPLPPAVHKRLGLAPAGRLITSKPQRLPPFPSLLDPSRRYNNYPSFHQDILDINLTSSTTTLPINSQSYQSEQIVGTAGISPQKKFPVTTDTLECNSNQAEEIKSLSAIVNIGDEDFDYRKFKRCNQTARDADIQDTKQLRKGVKKKKKSSLQEDTATPLDLEENQVNGWKYRSHAVSLWDVASSIPRLKLHPRIWDVVSAFANLHSASFSKDDLIEKSGVYREMRGCKGLCLFGNRVWIGDDLRSITKYPQLPCVWVRGDRIYDLDADRGYIDEFILDCKVAHVSDISRKEVRERRYQMGMQPFPYTPYPFGVNPSITAGDARNVADVDDEADEDEDEDSDQ